MNNIKYLEIITEDGTAVCQSHDDTWACQVRVKHVPTDLLIAETRCDKMEYAVMWALKILQKMDEMPVIKFGEK